MYQDLVWSLVKDNYGFESYMHWMVSCVLQPLTYRLFFDFNFRNQIKRIFIVIIFSCHSCEYFSLKICFLRFCGQDETDDVEETTRIVLETHERAALLKRCLHSASLSESGLCEKCEK